MSKPAVLFQKPKPDAMWARARFCTASKIAPSAKATMMASVTSWIAILPRRRVCRRKGCCDAARTCSAIGPLAANLADLALANRRTVLQPALGPQRIEAADDLQGRALTEIALEGLAVIADILDDPIRPIVGEAHPFAILALNAEQAPRLRIVRFQFLVDVGFVDAELFCIEHDIVRPAHDVGPLIVALPHRRAERLFRNDLRQNDVGARLGELLPLAIETGRIGGVGIAAARFVGFERVLAGGEGHGLEPHMIGTEEIGEVELAGRALLHADGSVVELERGTDLE